MISIYEENGNEIIAGLKCPCISDDTARFAQSLADDRQVAVWVAGEDSATMFQICPGDGYTNLSSVDVGCCQNSERAATRLTE